MKLLLLFFFFFFFMSWVTVTTQFYVPPSAHSALDTHLNTADIPSWTTLFQPTVLSVHNLFRTEYSAAPLSWNSTLAATMRRYVNFCVFTPSQQGAWGESLAAGYANSTAAVRAWGAEREEYQTGKLKAETGHFTQMVWNGTRSLGCAASLCDDIAVSGRRGWLLACAYWPRGNVNVDSDYVEENVGERVTDVGADGGEPGELPNAARKTAVGLWTVWWGAATVTMAAAVVGYLL